VSLGSQYHFENQYISFPNISSEFVQRHAYSNSEYSRSTAHYKFADLIEIIYFGQQYTYSYRINIPIIDNTDCAKVYIRIPDILRLNKLIILLLH